MSVIPKRIDRRCRYAEGNEYSLVQTRTCSSMYATRLLDKLDLKTPTNESVSIQKRFKIPSTLAPFCPRTTADIPPAERIRFKFVKSHISDFRLAIYNELLSNDQKAYENNWSLRPRDSPWFKNWHVEGGWDAIAPQSHTYQEGVAIISKPKSRMWTGSYEVLKKVLRPMMYRYLELFSHTAGESEFEFLNNTMILFESGFHSRRKSGYVLRGLHSRFEILSMTTRYWEFLDLTIPYNQSVEEFFQTFSQRSHHPVKDDMLATEWAEIEDYLQFNASAIYPLQPQQAANSYLSVPAVYLVAAIYKNNPKLSTADWKARIDSLIKAVDDELEYSRDWLQNRPKVRDAQRRAYDAGDTSPDRQQENSVSTSTNTSTSTQIAQSRILNDRLEGVSIGN